MCQAGLGMFELFSLFWSRVKWKRIMEGVNPSALQQLAFPAQSSDWTPLINLLDPLWRHTFLK